MKELVTEMERILDRHSRPDPEEESVDGSRLKSGPVANAGAPNSTPLLHGSVDCNNGFKTSSLSSLQSLDYMNESPNNNCNNGGGGGGGVNSDLHSLHSGRSGSSSPRRNKPKIFDTGELEGLLKKVLSASLDYASVLSSVQGSVTPSSIQGSVATNRTSRTSKSSSKRGRSTLYQLSCKHYVGQNFVGSTRCDLREKVKEHYGVVWQVVQTVYGNGGSADVDGSTNEQLSYRGSSFSHHLAGHCRDCGSREEAFGWCVENVRVERISRHTSLNRE